MSRSLDREDFDRAAVQLGAPAAHLRAVAEVEAPRGGFLPEGPPVALFERHLFKRFTRSRFDRTHPDLSGRPFFKSAGGYGGSMKQHERLHAASWLDWPAAHRATSFGRFQILGDNWMICGFTSLGAFVEAMWTSEDAHLRAFTHFVISKPDLAEAIRTGDWSTVKEIYNGPAQTGRDYAGDMQAAAERFANPRVLTA